MSRKSGKCKQCGETYESWYRHNRDKHGITGYGKKPSPGGEKPKSKEWDMNEDSTTCPLTRLSQLKKEIEDTVKSLEHERDGMHKKVLEMDTTIAKYKRMLITNQHD